MFRGDQAGQTTARAELEGAFARFAPAVLRVYRRDPEAFWAAVMAPFLAIWMAEEGLDDLVGRFDDILHAGASAVAGYGILDVNVDGARPRPVEILTAQALIAEYERRALDIFGVTPINASGNSAAKAGRT